MLLSALDELVTHARERWIWNWSCQICGYIFAAASAPQQNAAKRSKNAYEAVTLQQCHRLISSMSGHIEAVI